MEKNNHFSNYGVLEPIEITFNNNHTSSKTKIFDDFCGWLNKSDINYISARNRKHIVKIEKSDKIFQILGYGQERGAFFSNVNGESNVLMNSYSNCNESAAVLIFLKSYEQGKIQLSDEKKYVAYYLPIINSDELDKEKKVLIEHVYKKPRPTLQELINIGEYTKMRPIVDENDLREILL